MPNRPHPDQATIWDFNLAAFHKPVLHTTTTCNICSISNIANSSCIKPKQHCMLATTKTHIIQTFIWQPIPCQHTPTSQTNKWLTENDSPQCTSTVLSIHQIPTRVSNQIGERIATEEWDQASTNSKQTQAYYKFRPDLQDSCASQAKPWPDCTIGRLISYLTCHDAPETQQLAPSPWLSEFPTMQVSVGEKLRSILWTSTSVGSKPLQLIPTQD